MGDSNALVVNRQIMQAEPSLVVGKPVSLIIRGKAFRWTLVGVTDASPSPIAYATFDALAPIADSGRAKVVVVKAMSSSPAEQFDLVQRLRLNLGDNGLAVQGTQLMMEQRKVVEDHLLMVAGFLGIMAQLIIIVGGLGLASTMSMGVLERAREIGVLRAIGAPHRSIFAMVQVEGLVIAVLSWLAAIPLSIPMSVILARAFSKVMIAVPVTLLPEASGVMIWLGIVVGVSIVACAWPAARAMRVPAATALAYE